MLQDQNQVQFFAKATNLMGHIQQISDTVFKHNGNYLISASNDGTVRLWDLEFKKQIKVLFRLSYTLITNIAISNCDKYLAISCNNNGVHLFNIQTLSRCYLMYIFQPQEEEYISKMQFSPNANHIVLPGKYRINVWNLKFRKRVFCCQIYEVFGFIEGIAISFNIEFAVLLTRRFGIVIYNFGTRTFQVVNNYEHDPYGLGADITKDQVKLVTSGIYGEVKLWNIRNLNGNEKTLDLVWTILIFDKYIPKVIFSPDGNQILSICPNEGKIKIIDTKTGNEIQVLQFQKSPNLQTYICTNHDMSFMVGGGGIIDDIILWSRNINIKQNDMEMNNYYDCLEIN